jgi:hypothetical protein
MTRLLKLKRWFTLSEAARQLSTALGEDVSDADILRLALDNHLVLSAHFVNGAYARVCKIVDEKDHPPSVPDEGPVVYAISGHTLQARGEVFELEDEPYELTMMGSEATDVQAAYQHVTGGPKVITGGTYGAYVRDSGTWFQLQEPHRDNASSATKKLKAPWNHRDNFCLAKGLPHDSVLVVGANALTKTQVKLLQAETAEPKPITAREETTHLNIIGALLELIQTPRSGRSSQAAVIREILDNYGDKYGLSKATLEKKFAEANRSLRQT